MSAEAEVGCRPALPAPFRWEREHLLLDGPGGRALFSTRRGGVSAGLRRSLHLGRTVPDGEERAAEVIENRARLAQAAGVAAQRTAHRRQVHGNQVARVSEVPDGAWAAASNDGVQEGDGLVTDLEGVAVAVLTADCLPVALLGPGAVGVLHAGWRGLAAGVLEAGIAALQEVGVAAGSIVAGIGPGARRCCYEVGEEVHDQLFRPGERHRDGRRIDLPAIAAARLAEAGVGAVYDCGLCTMCESGRFFSHRRDGAGAGRQGALAWRS